MNRKHEKIIMIDKYNEKGNLMFVNFKDISFVSLYIFVKKPNFIGQTLSDSLSHYIRQKMVTNPLRCGGK